MPPRPTFPLNATERDEPVEFQLGDVVYRCADDLPAGALYRLVTLGPVSGTIGFIRGALADDEQRRRFDEQTLDTRRGRVVTEDVLALVLDYLTGVYTDRPTQRPENSPGGPQATNGSSPAASSSLAAVQ